MTYTTLSPTRTYSGHSPRLDLALARHDCHESVLRTQAIRHAHADDRALLVRVVLRREKHRKDEHKNTAQRAFP